MTPAVKVLLTTSSIVTTLFVAHAAGFPSELGLPVVRPVPTMANGCDKLTASSIGGYRNLVGKALAAARRDAELNGSTGRYKVAATNTRDILQRAYDRATEMVEFNQTQGNRNPNVTIYPEAGVFKTHLQNILNDLPNAAHWATISAAYHRSTAAVEAFDATTAAIARGGALMGDAGQCFMAYYMAGGTP